MKFFLIFFCFAGILSAFASQECNYKTMTRLQGGQSDQQGRLEVCRKGYWHNVCEQYFGQVDATVACRELGFSDKGAKRLTSGFLEGSGRQWNDNIMCNGTEESILQCPTSPSLYTRYCSSTRSNVGVQCEHPTEGELRILGGQNTSAGRLEVYSGGNWGTICDDYWSKNDALVACRQLGFSEGAQSVRTGFRKRQNNDTALIILDNLRCTGSERRLIDCKSNGLRVHNCQHNEDAGIICGKQGKHGTISTLNELLQILLEE